MIKESERKATRSFRPCLVRGLPTLAHLSASEVLGLEGVWKGHVIAVLQALANLCQRTAALFHVQSGMAGACSSPVQHAQSTFEASYCAGLLYFCVL